MTLIGLQTAVGVVLCIFATSPYHSHLLFLIEQYELPRFPELDWGNLELEWSRLRSQIPEPWKLNNDGREFQVGETMQARGLKPEHPVVMIPGIISTGLESWSTSPDYRGYFREKLWGGYHMLTQVMLNREKWISAMMLDPDTGLDPPGVKLRAAEGVDAASSFIQGYWIWSKIIENLAAVGYDTNSLNLAAYDWRLSCYNLETRDGYFSRLKTTIEGFKRRENRKVVLVAHSMGSTVRSFPLTFPRAYVFKWVEAEGYGNGGPTWVEDHIEAFVSVAGTLLPKAMTAFLSGEMKDTVAVNPAGAYVLERFFSRNERARLFRSWAGSASMWIKGGSAIWGNSTWAADDPLDSTHTHGEFVAFRALGGVQEPPISNLTAEKASNFILEHTPSSFQRMMATNYSFGIQKDESILTKSNQDHTKWTNPLESRLPYAPSMKIFCVYGHGKDTETSFHRYTRGDHAYDEVSEADVPDVQCDAPGSCTSQQPPLDMPLPRKSWIDVDVTDEKAVPKTKNGVRIGEGDGTVALISLGALCVEGWKRPRWNPANISIITYELPHLPQANIPRGGATTSDHVDILGSTGVNEVILKVVTGVGHEIEPQYVSPIREYAARMNWD
ncbi:Lecithin:cholesterol acyltransferase-domain-containing protein [Hysterangium stoloniferum]|nr:Lecithin:cholesterol acyltransferase-domain-containing protein [Hysterangium stoloniferum]